MIWKCTDCGKKLIWGGDHTYDDCGVETIIVYKKV